MITVSGVAFYVDGRQVCTFTVSPFVCEWDAGSDVVAHQVRAGKLEPEDITEKHVEQVLYTADVPDPDLLIRTSGEMRVSNFLLWQIAYTELWVTPTLWPDFGVRDLHVAVAEFQRRDRRFGRV